MILLMSQKLNLYLKASTFPCNDLFSQVLERNNLRYYIIFEFKILGYYRSGHDSHGRRRLLAIWGYSRRWQPAGGLYGGKRQSLMAVLVGDGDRREPGDGG